MAQTTRLRKKPVYLDVQQVGVVKPASPWKHVPQQHDNISALITMATRSEHAFSRVTRFLTFVAPPAHLFSPALPYLRSNTPLRSIRRVVTSLLFSVSKKRRVANFPGLMIKI